MLNLPLPVHERSSWEKKIFNKVTEKLFDIINESKYIQKLYIVEAYQSNMPKIKM